MSDTASLPITYQETVHLESARNSVISERAHEVRSLSGAYVPTSARANLEDSLLKVEYFYDTQDKPKGKKTGANTFAYENHNGYSFLLGSVTQRVDKLGIIAKSKQDFNKRLDSALHFLTSMKQKAVTGQHYSIIAESLESLRGVVLESLPDSSPKSS